MGLGDVGISFDCRPRVVLESEPPSGLELARRGTPSAEPSIRQHRWCGSRSYPAPVAAHIVNAAFRQRMRRFLE